MTSSSSLDPSPLRVGQILELALDDLDQEGRGVGRHQGQVIFVPGGLPGEHLRVRLRHQARRHWLGELLELLEPAADRRRPPCILAERCGGCSLQALRDDAQQRWKQRRVAEALRRIADLDLPLRPLLPAPAGLGYRNRAVIPLERREGRLRAGFYQRGSHRIVNMNHCPVLDPRLDVLIAPIKQDLEATAWTVDRHGGGAEGGLRHLALRIGQHSGEILISLIASHDRLRGVEELARTWLNRWPEVVGVSLNLQPLAGNRLLGEHTRVLAGRGELREPFAGVELRIAADSFFQVHTSQAERLVPLLLEALGPGSGQLLDAYCGIGTFSLPLAASGWRVLGIEQQASAVALARRNAAANGLAELAAFEVAAVGAVLADRLAGGAPSWNALLVDPPRKGLEPAALAAIVSGGPPLLLYLSCDPATLARDLAVLCREAGYRGRWLQPVDFFPNTSHVETLAVLER
jgi:23S rRNA (uracil1939-C5)-methyltransferase